MSPNNRTTPVEATQPTASVLVVAKDGSICTLSELTRVNERIDARRDEATEELARIEKIKKKNY